MRRERIQDNERVIPVRTSPVNGESKSKKKRELSGICKYLGAIGVTVRGSRFELGPNLNRLGAIGMGHGLNGWKAIIATVTSSACGGPVGFKTRDPGFDFRFLSQTIG